MQQDPTNSTGTGTPVSQFSYVRFGERPLRRLRRLPQLFTGLALYGSASR
ncbi:hypothetical protein OG389_34790 [Streptomyces sp. NBC_00435]